MENPSDIWSTQITDLSDLGCPTSILERCFLSSVLYSSQSEPKKWGSSDRFRANLKIPNMSTLLVGSCWIHNICWSMCNNKPQHIDNNPQHKKNIGTCVLHSDSMTLATLFLKGRGTYQIGPLWSSDDFALKPTVRGTAPPKRNSVRALVVSNHTFKWQAKYIPCQSMSFQSHRTD